eukprot:CAMPEP_0205805306 /NCGR_PEP_ID=MMETSP0205-20121125/8488_1 /ASSEMBLY_ACC=CAM_ASM_000278 /TAXON_ID=36767 /ORGANISM="Euplotes focardii, Strain TN1" /LENGTH=76 /DNA_ID=CAMNT_0053076309 /DNA_START=359 /DNA_END=589 /DNA_ORIENTATION=+
MEKDSSDNTSLGLEKPEKEERNQTTKIDDKLNYLFNQNLHKCNKNQDSLSKIKDFKERKRFGKKHDREMYKRLKEL